MATRPPRTIRFQILIAVNSVLAMVIVAFLVLDYQREMSERLEDRRASLKEEARNLTLTIPGLCGTDSETIQAFIDQVCGHVSDRDSPGHHIVARVGGVAYQPRSHHRASHDMLRAVEGAASSPGGEGELNGQPIIVGSATGNGLTVHVSEYLSTLTRSVQERFGWRVIAVLALGALAAALVNVVLVRVVARPLDGLVGAVNAIASGDLSHSAQAAQSSEIAALADAVNQMRSSLSTAREHRVHEMDRARKIQEHLLPQGVVIPGLAVATVYQPAATVSGDYYDLLKMPDGAWLLCLADVTGHGVPAALGAAMLKMLLLEATERIENPGEILEYIDDRFSRVSLPEVFATMALLRWSEATGVVYASAGHDPLLHLRPGQAPEEYIATRPLVGLGIARPPVDLTIDVSAGDRLYLVTDGLAEAHDANGEMFGRQRVIDNAVAASNSSLAQAVKDLASAVSDFRGPRSQSDDLTVLAIELGAM